MAFASNCMPPGLRCILEEPRVNSGGALPKRGSSVLGPPMSRGVWSSDSRIFGPPFPTTIHRPEGPGFRGAASTESGPPAVGKGMISFS